MPIVASVRLRYVSKDYWFDPNGLEVVEGDHVLVETERGREIGLCTGAGLEVAEKDLVSPLKPVLRVATEEDYRRADELDERSKEAMARFRELVEEQGLDMKPVSVEFMFDGNRATFFFTADERVDFRALVRELASEFHVRVDMRQIGVRDEARALGGLGHCGQELCCARMGGDFMPVSIRMAKEQDLPLNPTKISGLCGRLMCCLRYEFEAYKDFKSRAPKKNAMIETPMGLAKVVEFDTPRETVRVRFEDGKSMNIPVSAMDTGDKVAREGERLRPCHVSQEAFDKIIEELHHDTNLAMMGDKLFSDNPDLADREAKAGSVERAPRRRRRGGGSSGDAGTGASRSGSGSGRSRRGGRGSGSGGGQRAEDAAPPARTQRKRRRSVAAVEGEQPRSTTRSDGEGGSGGNGSSSGQRSSGGGRRRRRSSGSGGAGGAGASGSSSSVSRERSSQKAAGKPRPGQHSSTVSGDAAEKSRGEGSGSGQKRRRRRRGGRGRGAGSANGDSNGKPTGGAGE